MNSFNKGIIDDILLLENGDFDTALGEIEEKEVREILKDWRSMLTRTREMRRGFRSLWTL